jgi:hypothetical protein
VAESGRNTAAVETLVCSGRQLVTTLTETGVLENSVCIFLRFPRRSTRGNKYKQFRPNDSACKEEHTGVGGGALQEQELRRIFDRR